MHSGGRVRRGRFLAGRLGGRQPRRRRGVPVLGREVQHPIHVHEFVSKIDPEALQRLPEAVIGGDAVRADQQHQVRRERGGLRGRQPLLLPRQSVLDLGPHGRRIQRLVQGSPVGVEDHPAGGAFDVNRPAILAALAIVGHHGIGVFFPLARLFEVRQVLFQAGQGGGHLLQLFARRFRPGGLGGRLRPDARQRPFLFPHLGVFGLDLLFYRRLVILLRPQAFGGAGQLVADEPDLLLRVRFLAGQSRVGGLAVPLSGVPGLLPLPLESGVAGFRLTAGLLGGAAGGLRRAEAGGVVGAPVHHQQHQQQRPHRAQEHGQEGERGYLQFVASGPHAAFPSRGAGGIGPPDCAAVRAVRRWAAAVRP